MSGTFYITTAIDYPNNAPHLGTAYEKVTADVIARYQRIAGKRVYFLMGNDEHSLKVAQEAQKRGLTPQAWCDQMEAAFKERWAALDVSYDDFIRTSEARHKQGVLALIEAVKKNNPDDIYEAIYKGWYCYGCEGFKLDKDLVEKEEEGGKKVRICPDHPTRTPEWLEEKNHFFRLSKYQEALRELLAKDASFLQPDTRRNELLSFLKEKLEDLSISRPASKALGWAIPFPGDPESIIYVWFDALTNYISAVGYGSDEKKFAEWWPADIHVIGKDITRFHCIYWPAMLMAGGVPRPKHVFGHGWIHFQGERMSKTLGNIVDPLELAQRLGPDALRLYLIREIVYGQDGDFTLQRFEERYNADLANNYGNLVARITSMADKYRPGATIADPGNAPSKLKDAAAVALDKYRAAMDRYLLHDGAAAAFELIDATNKFLQDDAKPWELAKDPAKAKELDRALHDALEATRIATILLYPVMPRNTRAALGHLGDSAAPALARATWGAAGALKSSKAPPLFPRIEDPEKAKAPKPAKK